MLYDNSPQSCAESQMSEFPNTVTHPTAVSNHFCFYNLNYSRGNDDNASHNVSNVFVNTSKDIIL